MGGIMTIEELFSKALADDELKKSLAEAVKSGTIAEWVASQGVEATEDELIAYMKATVMENGELTDEQLDKVAGGGFLEYLGSVWITVISVGMTGDGCWE